MKRIHLLVSSILLFASAAKGQSQFGFKAGINVANQKKTISIAQVPSSQLDTKPFVGYQLGFFYKTKSYNRFLLTVEANFSVIGSGRTSMAPDGTTYNTHEKLGYIELPVISLYSINKFYFGLGPGIGFKLFSKLTKFENRTFDIPYYKTIDAAVNILAGYKISRKIYANIRYSYGLVNIWEDPGYANTRNRFFNLSILYSLK